MALIGRAGCWAQVYGLYIGLLLSALNRLPLKLPQRGAGRRHLGSQPQQTVTFDDVAGVDEAKEELAEIVVCRQGLSFLDHVVTRVDEAN